MESKSEGAKPKDDTDSPKTLAMPELMKKLGSSADGLTQAEATKRQALYGPNQIEEKKTNEYLKFLSYFWGPIPWMIEAAVILSGVVRHWLDFFIILLLLFSNALVAFWEVEPLASDENEFDFDEAYSFQRLFTAVAELCGLTGKMAATGYTLPVIGIIEAAPDDDDADDDGEEA